MENYIKLISYLLHSRTQVHVFHLQTPSFAAHKALNEYYDGIVDHIDGLVESYQGKYGILRGYKNFTLLEHTDNEQVINYLSALCKTVDILRKETPDSYIQNQIDNVVQLLNSTMYKLKYLS